MNPVPDSQAGWTWDGGPRPQSPLLAFAPFPVGRSQPLVVARIGSRSVTQDCQRLEQVPKLESSDEGSVGVASIADREFQGSVWQVENVSAAALISGFFTSLKTICTAGLGDIWSVVLACSHCGQRDAALPRMVRG